MKPLDPVQRSVAAEYERIWQNALSSFTEGRVESDPYLTGDIEDNRRGITLIIRPSPEATNSLRPFMGHLRREFCEQYIIPESDLHLTVLAMRPVELGFTERPQSLDSIITAINRGLESQEKLKIDLIGFGASPSAVFVCGFSEGDMVNSLRDRIRQACRATSVAEELDKRYVVKLAHMTVLRFVEPSISKRQLAILSELRNELVGSFLFDTIELVNNDFYMKYDRTTLYCRWTL